MGAQIACLDSAMLTRKLIFLVPLLACPLSGAFGQTPDTPGTAPKYSVTEMRTYRPSSRAAIAIMGQMKLSSSFLSFAKFPGHMNLEYAGVLTDVPARGHVRAESAGAPVYRVTNAEEYFHGSKICSEPVRWIALPFISVRANGAVGGWVHLSTSSELSQFEAGECSSNVFWPNARH